MILRIFWMVSQSPSESLLKHFKSIQGDTPDINTYHNLPPRCAEKPAEAAAKPTTTSTAGDTIASQPTTASLPIVAATGDSGASASHVFASTSAS
jgi:hypothetical protein